MLKDLQESAVQREPNAFEPSASELSGSCIRERSGAREVDGIVVGRATRHLFELAERVGHADLPVLILGETGVGKEVLARAFHERSARARGPFVEINCAAIAPMLAESILFGHERGAFTGADRRTPGLFEQADGGTLFLDEVGELSLAAQGALLRVLESRRVRRVGATLEKNIDVRLLAATNRKLQELVAAGQFREDLLYRLKALSVLIPPLRERRDELAPLAQLFLQRASERWNAPARSLSNSAARSLEAYPWPGNVRELRNAVERSVALCAGPVVDREHLPEHVACDPLLPTAAVASGDSPRVSLPEQVRSFEIARIREALLASDGNRTRAARMLGLPRRTLGSKLRDYGLDQSD